MKKRRVSDKSQRSVNKEKNLSIVATFRGHQKTIHTALRSSNELRKGADDLLSTFSALGATKAITAMQFQISFASLCQYIFLSSLDLSCLLEEMISTRSRWKKKLYARLVALPYMNVRMISLFYWGNHLENI